VEKALEVQVNDRSLALVMADYSEEESQRPALGELTYIKVPPKQKEMWHFRRMNFVYHTPDCVTGKINIQVGDVIEKIEHEGFVSRVANVFFKVRWISLWAHRRSAPAEIPLTLRIFELNDRNEVQQSFSSYCPRVRYVPPEGQGDTILSGNYSGLLLAEIEKPPHLDVTVAFGVSWQARIEDFADWLPWFQRPDEGLSDQDLTDHLYKLRSRYGRCTDLEFAEALGRHSKELWDRALKSAPKSTHLPDDYPRKIRGKVSRGDLAAYYQRLFERHKKRFLLTQDEVVVRDPDGEVMTRQIKLAEVKRHYKDLYEDGIIDKKARDFYCSHPLSDEAVDAISTQLWSDVMGDGDDDEESDDDSGLTVDSGAVEVDRRERFATIEDWPEVPHPPSLRLISSHEERPMNWPDEYDLYLPGDDAWSNYTDEDSERVPEPHFSSVSWPDEPSHSDVEDNHR